MNINTIFLTFCLFSDVFAYKLSQVVIISRHNIRAPQMKADLGKITPKDWPKWKENLGYLTEKGGELESDMGKYFSQWLQREGLFHECPYGDAVIYANERQRTKESAKKFTETAFKDCNVTIQVNKEYFYSKVRNNSESFLSKSKKEIENKLRELDLYEAYKKLNKVLDINKSQMCKNESYCDLTNVTNNVSFELDEQPDLDGPLFISNSVVDAFLMAYYNGVPVKDIGWGAIKNEDLKTLTKITNVYNDARFNVTYFALNLVQPLISEIDQIVKNNELKFAIFVGHDSTLYPVLCALDFKPYFLPNSYEKTPVGSKLVFQKWYDDVNDRFLLKVEFVYLSIEQLRQGTKISLESPPSTVVMELNSCAVNADGFCPWEDFVNALQKLQSV